MATNQLVFMAVPAFVGRIRSQTACDFQLSKTDYDENAAVSVDLKNNVLDAAWDDVQVDASVSADPPGLTSIGPAFHIGSHKGAVYLEMGLYTRLRAAGKLADWPPPADRPYQYQGVVRRNAAGGLDRFHGFAAAVLEVSGASVARVAVYQVGKGAPQKVLWLDLNDPATCDPRERELTTLTPTVGSSGALFLSWNEISANDLLVPKLPPGDGGGTLPMGDNR